MVVPCPALLMADDVELPLETRVEALNVKVLDELKASPDAELPTVVTVDCVYELDVIWLVAVLGCCVELPEDVGEVPVPPVLLAVVADDESEANDPATLTVLAIGDVLV